MRLLEKHPDQFEEAMSYEKYSMEPGKTFTWMKRMPLSELKKPENVAAIKARHAEKLERLKKNRGNKKLVETLGGMEVEIDDSPACLICHL